MRYVREIILSLDNLYQYPLFGMGLGMGTNAGSQMLVGKKTFLIGESEIQRNIAESGPILGILYLLWRWGLMGWLLVNAFQLMMRGQPLALLIWCAAAPLLFMGQLGRPTTLGFTVFSSALCYLAIVTAGEEFRLIKMR